MSRQRVLIVESDRSHQLVLQNILEADYEIEAVSDPELALERLLAARFDLFILGVSKEQKECLELARSIASIKKHQNKPVLYLTPKEDCRGEQLGLRANPQQILSKPFTSVCLRNKMFELLNGDIENSSYLKAA